MKPTDIYKLLERYQLNAKKHFGQNFLADNNYLKRITDAGKLDKETGVVEIGPGLGSLTNYLVEESGFVMCYEIDHDMVKILKENLIADNLTIIEGDFLKADVASDIYTHLKNYENIVLVANLPYYITTAILLKILEDRLPIKRMVVMMQKEVADRIAGKPDTKDYNALSVLIQYLTNVKKLFDVSPEAFIPRPDVTSSVVYLERKQTIEHKPLDEAYFFKVNRIIFSQRRKTIINNLNKELQIDKPTLQNILSELGFTSNIRAESLLVDDIIKISDALYKHTEKQQ